MKSQKTKTIGNNEKHYFAVILLVFLFWSIKGDGENGSDDDI